MAASPWKDPRIEEPNDADTVWVKQPFGHPFQAVWNEARSSYETVLHENAQAFIPWYEIYLWRPI